ncbi:hypothetical protein FSP39_019614 [Pinctada imbricata]|uniref:Uncharacterized protein n=1 Tax=Pinctada imbricata TaxID=66713 RepID=A0AA89CDH5_PINIB|nr:hypothetical protein FSP39_019614 [Pinctada imbricata]
MVKEVIEHSYLMRDLPQLSPRHQTYGLEVFHSIVSHLAPKSTHFFHLMMLARLYIAAHHFNANRNRAQAKRRDGAEMWKPSYPKATKGTECVVKKCKVPAAYGMHIHLIS